MLVLVPVPIVYLGETDSVDVARGLVLLFGIGTRALPSWDSRTRRNNLLGGLAGSRTAGPSGHANPPHPSSREGTSFHRSVELEFSPIGFDPERFSCCCSHGPRFTISLKRSTQNLQLSTSWADRLPHLLGPKQDVRWSPRYFAFLPEANIRPITDQ